MAARSRRVRDPRVEQSLTSGFRRINSWRERAALAIPIAFDRGRLASDDGVTRYTLVCTRSLHESRDSPANFRELKLHARLRRVTCRKNSLGAGCAPSVSVV